MSGRVRVIRLPSSTPIALKFLRRSLAPLALLFAIAPATAYGQSRTADFFSTPWWEELGDADLTALLSEAARQNGDLQAAVDRMLQADATAVRTRSALMPTLSLDGQASTGPLDGLGFQFGGIPRGDGGATELPTLFYTGSANVRARYRLSSWGAEYRSYRASRLEAMAARGDEDGVALNLVGQLAGAYYDAVSAARQVAVIARQVEVGEQLAQVSQLRYERGDATALEVLQQRQQLATTRASLPPARAEMRLARARLESLLGGDALSPTRSIAAELPSLPTRGAEVDLAVSTEARPDLRSAEDRLEAAGSRVSGAKWGYLPDIDLSANSGSQFFRSVGTTTQSTWGASLTLSIPILDGSARSSQIREASANERAARSSFEQLRRAASAEVATAGIQEEEQRAQLAALQDQLDASQRAFDESRRRYLAGLATVLDVLNAMNGMQQAELGVIRTHRTVLASWIQYRQAAGGPWTTGLRQRLLEAS